MSFELTQLIGFMSGGTDPATKVYNGNTSSSSTTSPVSVASVPIGTASATRLVVCAVYWSTAGVARTLNSATIGGVAATIHVQKRDTSTITNVAIISATVTTGTTATVALTFSGNIAIGVEIESYSLDNLISTTPTATASNATSSATSVSTTINVPAAGIMIAGQFAGANTAQTFTSTGAAMDSDTQMVAASARESSASGQNMAAATGQSVQFSSGTSIVRSMAVACWN